MTDCPVFNRTCEAYPDRDLRHRHTCMTWERVPERGSLTQKDWAKWCIARDWDPLAEGPIGEYCPQHFTESRLPQCKTENCRLKLILSRRAWHPRLASYITDARWVGYGDSLMTPAKLCYCSTLGECGDC